MGGWKRLGGEYIINCYLLYITMSLNMYGISKEHTDNWRRCPFRSLLWTSLLDCSHQVRANAKRNAFCLEKVSHKWHYIISSKNHDVLTFALVQCKRILTQSGSATIEFSRNTQCRQCWYFCTTSNSNKL